MKEVPPLIRFLIIKVGDSYELKKELSDSKDS